MTAKNNILEDHIPRSFFSHLTGKVVWFLNCVERKIASVPPFSPKLGLSTFETIKKMFAKKNSKKKVEKLFLNVPQDTDKKIFKMEINALFACFN